MQSAGHMPPNWAHEKRFRRSKTRLWLLQFGVPAGRLLENLRKKYDIGNRRRRPRRTGPEDGPNVFKLLDRPQQLLHGTAKPTHARTSPGQLTPERRPQQPEVDKE